MKEDKKMPMDKKAKMDNLQALKKLAMQMINDGHGESEMPDGKMEKVMVAAKDKSGLKKGLEKASEMVGDESPAEEAAESPEQEAMEDASDELGEHEQNDEQRYADLCRQVEELKAKLGK